MRTLTASLAISGHAVADDGGGAAGLPNGAQCTLASTCTSTYCVDGVCCASACSLPCEVCGEGGECVPAPPRSTPRCGACCDSLACTGDAGACATRCATTAECIATAYCAAAVCIPRQAGGAACAAADECASGDCYAGICLDPGMLGATCAAAGDCASGACVDGVCCDGACAGQCEACDVAPTPGRCTPVDGVPHGERSNCTGAKTTCAGTCQGTGGNVATCAYPDAGAVCNPTCTTNADCGPRATCQAGGCVVGSAICVDDEHSENDGGITTCGAYVCDGASGTCLVKCTKFSDCIAPNVCDPNAQQCVAPGADDGRLRGCACDVLPRSDSWESLVGALVGCGLVARRARRRTR